MLRASTSPIFPLTRGFLLVYEVQPQLVLHLRTYIAIVVGGKREEDGGKGREGEGQGDNKTKCLYL